MCCVAFGALGPVPRPVGEGTGHAGGPGPAAGLQFLLREGRDISSFSPAGPDPGQDGASLLRPFSIHTTDGC